jgi:hypothetical protein
MSNVFGFSTAPSEGGDFMLIVKYDARAGRVFRLDRVDNGSGYESDAVDITPIFKALADFENIEVGWIKLPPVRRRISNWCRWVSNCLIGPLRTTRTASASC